MNIIFITDKNKFFGQTRKPWVSINTDQFIAHLNDFGVTCKITNFPNISIREEFPKQEIIFYHFSQKENLRYYLRDVAEVLHSLGNRLIPSIELLRCHENKGYQELLKKIRKIDAPAGYYISSIDDVDLLDIKFPIVVKTIDGSNGKGVYLCKNKEEIRKKLKKYIGTTFLEKIDLFRRRYFRKNKNYPEYPEYNNYTDYLEYKNYINRDIRFVVQEFIPNQKNDFRVLVFYDKYYVTKRHNRDGDFRASGAKKFDINFDIDENLLSAAESFKKAFPDTPYLSMDIIYDERDNKYKLLEFQALHFGINVLVKNSGYFIKENDFWKKVLAKNTIEEELAYGLNCFLQNLKNIAFALTTILTFTLPTIEYL